MRIGMVFGNGLIPQGSVTEQNLLFSKQLGVNDIIIHLPEEETFPSTFKQGYWELDEIMHIKKYIESFGLRLAGIENFHPCHWHDILLDGPKKQQQMENLKRSVVNLGKCGIPMMGYYFSIAGVWGRTYGPFARGNALCDAFTTDQELNLQQPIPKGEVWGMTYDKSLLGTGFIDPVSEEEMWSRLEYFLKELVPVAEQAGVHLAAHPDDPPLPVLRQTARLITHPDKYQRLLDIVPSKSNGLEFCQGTLSYMPNGNIYEAIKKYASQDRITYIHFRNNVGTLPTYYETFMDDGDWDMIKCIKLYHENGFDGIIIPDHTPEVASAAPFHVGMAHAIGYMKAAITMVENGY